MNKERLWVFAGLGILATALGIMGAKKYQKRKKKRSVAEGYEAEPAKPRYRQRVQ